MYYCFIIRVVFRSLSFSSFASFSSSCLQPTFPSSFVVFYSCFLILLLSYSFFVLVFFLCFPPPSFSSSSFLLSLFFLVMTDHSTKFLLYEWLLFYSFRPYFSIFFLSLLIKYIYRIISLIDFFWGVAQSGMEYINMPCRK